MPTSKSRRGKQRRGKSSRGPSAPAVKQDNSGPETKVEKAPPLKNPGMQDSDFPSSYHPQQEIKGIAIVTGIIFLILAILSVTL